MKQAVELLRSARMEALPVVDPETHAMRGMLSEQMLEKAMESRMAEWLTQKQQ